MTVSDEIHILRDLSHMDGPSASSNSLRRLPELYGFNPRILCASSGFRRRISESSKPSARSCIFCD